MEVEDSDLIQSIWSQFDEIRNNEIDSTSVESVGNQKKGDIIKIWIENLRSESSPYSEDHVCSDSCSKQGNIERIDRINKIYGCKFGRIPHICYGDPSNCRLVEYNADGEAVCIFSGAVLYPSTVSDLYGKGERGITKDLTGKASLEEIEISELLNKNLAGIEYNLNWSNRVFKPFEQFEEFKDTDKNITRKYVLKDRTQINLSEIRFIITDLLFNMGERNRINKKYQRTRVKRAKDAYRQYLKERKRRNLAPTKHRIITIISAYLRDTSYLQLIDYDKPSIEFFQRLILNLWFAIKQTPYFLNNESKFHIKQHALGMLYMLTTPLMVSDDDGRLNVLLEANEFLRDHLPPQNELKEWNSGKPSTKYKYTKKDVTTGTNNFKRAIGSAINKEKVFQAIKDAPRKRIFIF